MVCMHCKGDDKRNATHSTALFIIKKFAVFLRDGKGTPKLASGLVKRNTSVTYTVL